MVNYKLPYHFKASKLKQQLFLSSIFKCYSSLAIVSCPHHFLHSTYTKTFMLNHTTYLQATSQWIR